MTTSKSILPPLTFGGQILETDDVGAGGLGGLGIGALGEHGDAHALADAARQHDGAAHHLVGFTGIDAQDDGGIDGFVELGGGGFLDQAQGLVNGVVLGTLDLGFQSLETLGNSHVTHPPR
jgi:hypothetical protein